MFALAGGGTHAPRISGLCDSLADSGAPDRADRRFQGRAGATPGGAGAAFVAFYWLLRALPGVKLYFIADLLYCLARGGGWQRRFAFFTGPLGLSEASGLTGRGRLA